MSPHLQHPTRANARPIRPGDRVRDSGAAHSSGGNYPGASLFGTVVSEPGYIYERVTYGPLMRVSDIEWVEVAFDDHVTVHVPLAALVRL